MCYGKTIDVLIVFISLLFIVVSQGSVTQASSANKQDQNVNPLKKSLNQNTLFSSKKCGFTQKALYMNNGTYETIGFYSSRKFSLIVQQDSHNLMFTGLAMAHQISESELQQHKKTIKKVFRLKNTSSVNQTNISRSDAASNSSNRLHFASLDIYSICKTVAISSDSKDLQVQITYFIDDFSQNVQNDGLNKQNSSKNMLLKDILKIQATVYCIEESSIVQANFFITKIYYFLIASLYGLLIHFRPLENVPLYVRFTFLSAYVWASFYAEDWYASLIISYAGILFLVFIYKTFSQKGPIISRITNRNITLTKTFVIVSLASAVPLALRSHLSNQNVQPKKFILHIINIVILCNNGIIVCSLVNLARFRHAFYYFLGFALAEHYFSQKICQSLIFEVISPQMFPTPFECNSFFFLLWLLPLCNFFFQEFTSEKFIKFCILLAPILLKPFNLSYTSSFLVIFLTWASNQAMKGRDLIKLIKYKK